MAQAAHLESNNNPARQDTPVRRTAKTYKVSIIIPALNEAQNIPVLFERINKHLNDSENTEFIFVDDGSTDNTLDVLRSLAKDDKRVKYISFSRNFGHQPALRAGLEYASGDCGICIDADLQHPPEMLQEMIDKWREGYDVVSTVRMDSASLPWLKRFTSRLFYRTLNYLGDLRVEPGSADFRLVDRKVIQVLKTHSETDIFFRGLLPKLGFHRISLPYNPAPRLHGKTNYDSRAMAKLALNAILSTSMRPLRIATLFSILVATIAGAYALYAIFIYIFYDISNPGWTSVVLIVSMIGAMQLLVLGIIGEYLGQTLREVRNRPSFIVSEANIDGYEADDFAARRIELAGKNR